MPVFQDFYPFINFIVDNTLHIVSFYYVIGAKKPPINSGALTISLKQFSLSTTCRLP
jgi:hypothetical protein